MANNLLFKLLVLLCLAVPFKAVSQSYDWVAIGDPFGGASYFSMQFENQITGEIVLAFCGQNATTAPSVGDRYYLHENGEWLMPEDGSLQIMYIFQSECDYEKPILEPLEDCLAFENNITLTTNCLQGTPVWYRKASLELVETGRGNSLTIPISWSHYYVRCENNDATCYSEFVHANLAYDYAIANPQPSKTNICIGEEVNLSLESGCSYYEGYFDKWYLDEHYTQPVNGTLVRPLTTTTYYLRCVNLSGCTGNLNNSLYPVTITVDPSCTAPCTDVPNPSISGSNTICNNGTTVLSATGCINGFGYLWSNNATTASITVNTPGVYSLKCVNSIIENCESLPSEPITVFTVNSITAKPPLPICSGTTASLSVTGCESGELTWTHGLTGNPAITPPLYENQEYLATCTIGSCVSSIAVKVGVNIETIQSGTPVCSEDGLTYSVPFTISTGATLVSTTQGSINGTIVQGIPSGTEAVVTAQRGCLVSTSISHTCDVQELFFDLALRKTKSSGSKAIFKIGDVVTFNLTVFNQGTVAATSVDLVDYIPTGLTLDDANWIIDGNKARWAGAVTNLLPGEESTVSITFTINSEAGENIINTAEISNAENAEGLEDIDSRPDDDKDNDGPVKNDEINEDGKEGRDEDDHDIEQISVCIEGKCLNAKVNRKK